MEPKQNVQEFAENKRESLKAIEQSFRIFKDELFKKDNIAENEDRGEVIANFMLSLRHLEDCRMRLGKMIQYFNGGESCYKK